MEQTIESTAPSGKLPKGFPKKSPKIISFLNNKGGVFKTTLTFNLAKNYLRNNRTVTTVDFDQQ